MLAVGFGTAALVIALSVFNGLEDLLRSLHGSFDPELKINIVHGKSFETTPEFVKAIRSIQGVAYLTEVIEDNVYVRYRDSELVVTLKGVGDQFEKQGQIEEHIVFGQMNLQANGTRYALIGRGVQYALKIVPSDELHTLQIHYPKKVRPGSALPTSLTRQKNILPGGVFAVEKQYDERYILVPLDFAQDLLNYGDRRTSIEIKTTPESKVEDVQERIRAQLGKDYSVLSREEQHADIMKIIRIEKLFVFLIFSFIIVIASFNIFFSLTMLTIEKRNDVAVLYALGANDLLIRRIFVTEGSIIAFMGAASGLTLGFLICWTQQTFELISMGMETAVLEAYPVKIEMTDFALTAVTLVAITISASFHPAIQATKRGIASNLL